MACCDIVGAQGIFDETSNGSNEKWRREGLSSNLFDELEDWEKQLRALDLEL
jgi:hypothetical protein